MDTVIVSPLSTSFHLLHANCSRIGQNNYYNLTENQDAGHKNTQTE